MLEPRPGALRWLGLVLALWAEPSWSETFRIVIAGQDVGTVRYLASADQAQTRRLETELSGTPLGVFEGGFAASSRLARGADGQTVRQYLTEPGTARDRTVSVVLSPAGQALRTEIDPARDRTEVSEASAVPGPVVDPVTAFGRLVTAGGCPDPIRSYDGRRVVLLEVTAARRSGRQTICDARYQVLAGAPHLSPLRLRSMSLTLTYEDGDLTEITAQTRLFTGQVRR